MPNPNGFLITITGSIEVFEDETVEQAIAWVRENLTIDEMIEAGHLEITGKELDY